jgi:hypothetical protein
MVRIWILRTPHLTPKHATVQKRRQPQLGTVTGKLFVKTDNKKCGIHLLLAGTVQRLINESITNFIRRTYRRAE